MARAVFAPGGPRFLFPLGAPFRHIRPEHEGAPPEPAPASPAGGAQTRPAFPGRKALPVKIALLASTFLPRIGGAELAVHNLAAHLQKMGHEVTIIAWWGH